MTPIASRKQPTQPTPPTQPLPPAEVDRLADEIAELSSQLDAATHRLLTLVRLFDEGSGWATHGALSCAHWLEWRIGLDLGAAREHVRVARALAMLPQIDDALRRGALSYAKTRALTRVATAANEATLLEMATHATASQLERICRSYRRVRSVDAADGAARPESLADEELRRFVRTADTDDGMVRIDARLRPEEAAMLLQALDVARRLAWRPRSGAAVAAAVCGEDSARLAAGAGASDVPAGTSQRHPALSRADALVVVAEAFLAAAARDDRPAAVGAGAVPVELVVHVDAAALRAESGAITTAIATTIATTDATDGDHAARRHDNDNDMTQHHATLADGAALPIATVQRLACDAAVVTVAHDATGKVTSTSRRTRRLSSTLRRALRSRDDGCRFPGCTNRITDAHHLVAWVDGGATSLSNLLELCRRHHRLVHEHGYRIETATGGERRFLRGDGTPLPRADERRVALDRTGDAVEALADAHAARGLVIDAATAFPRWDGEPVDYALAVQALVG